MKALSHPVLSQQAQDALSGKPFIQSDRYTSAEWDEALWYARQGDMADLELMIEMDAAHARADTIARHDPAYREGHVDLSDWLGGRDIEGFVPRVTWGMGA